MKEIATLTQVVEITEDSDIGHQTPPANWKVFKINGPLFFAAADRILGELAQGIEGLDGVIVHMHYSAYLDAGGFTAIEKLIAHCDKNAITIRFSGWQFQPLKTLARARTEAKGPLDFSFSSLDDAITDALNMNRDNTAAIAQ
jgi:SulP family sulfate permease